MQLRLSQQFLRVQVEGKQALDRFVVAEPREIHRHQPGGEIRPFEKDGGEFDVDLLLGGRRQQIGFILQHDVDFLELRLADLLDAGAQIGVGEGAVLLLLIQNLMNAGVKEPLPVFEQQRLGFTSVDFLGRRPGQQNDLGRKKLIRLEGQLVLIDMAKEELPIDDDRIGVRHAPHHAVQFVNFLNDAIHDARRHQHGPGVGAAQGFL